MKEELHVVTLQSTVNQLLVELCAKSDRSQRLCFTTSENSTSVRSRQWRNLAPDRTDVSGLTTIETHTLVEDATTHGIALHIVVVAVDERIFLFQFLFAQIRVSSSVCLLVILTNLLESLCTILLLKTLLRHVVSRLVALGSEVCLQVVIIHLVAILTLHILAQLLHQLLLQAALRLDSVVCCLERFEKVFLLHFLHLTFHHHDVFFSGTHHQVHISLLQLLEGWVNHELAIDACNTHL